MNWLKRYAIKFYKYNSEDRLVAFGFVLCFTVIGTALFYVLKAIFIIDPAWVFSIFLIALVVWLIFYSFIAYGKKLSKKKQNNIDQLNIPTNPEAILTQDEINHLINKKD